MNYIEYYGLNMEPFSNAPDTRFYYNSAQHSKALTRLMFAVETMKGLAVLIGDIGMGKTTLARRMLDNLPEEEYEAALLVIIHQRITPDWLLRRIAIQLGVEKPASDKITLLTQLYDRLMQLYEKKKKAVVLIDEAQMLKSAELMEEFRGLLNLETPERKLITFVFFGLPDIEEALKLDEPLAQRVALKYRLELFNEESTEAYVKHRLRYAGAKKDLFTPKALQAIHRYSRGVPRTINTLCDNSLFEGFLLKQEVVDENVINNIATDLGLIESGKIIQRGLNTPASEYSKGAEERVPKHPPQVIEKHAPEKAKTEETGDNEIDAILSKIEG